MLQVKDCRCICLFCQYYDACRKEIQAEREREEGRVYMNPKYLKYSLKSEDTEQAAVISWAQWQQGRYPELKMLYHCPNGGSRNKIEAAKLKQMGVVAGVPDLHLPVPRGSYHGLYIELKYGGGRLEKTQREFLQSAAGYGYYAVCCYGAETAIRTIQEYLNLDDGGRMAAENASVLKEGQVKPL